MGSSPLFLGYVPSDLVRVNYIGGHGRTDFLTRRLHAILKKSLVLLGRRKRGRAGITSGGSSLPHSQEESSTMNILQLIISFLIGKTFDIGPIDVTVGGEKVALSATISVNKAV